MTLDSLHPSDRSYLLVGKFLQRWALMEAQLREAIGKALGLDTLQTVVACANISLRDKINILKTAVNMSVGLTNDEKAKYTKALNSIANYSPVRNMIAHDMFWPTEDGKGVQFFVIRAKGKFEIPDMQWDQKKFNEEYRAIDSFKGELAELVKRLGHAQLLEALASAMSDEPSNLGFGRLRLQGLLNPPPPEPLSLGRNLSTPETGPQTPEEPEE